MQRSEQKETYHSSKWGPKKKTNGLRKKKPLAPFI